MPIGRSGAAARPEHFTGRLQVAACHRPAPAPISTPPGPGHSAPASARKAPALLDRFIGIAGIIVILAIAFLLSSNRRAIRLRVVGSAFALQAGIAVLVLLTPGGAR
jgi:hypothetical protein